MIEGLKDYNEIEKTAEELRKEGKKIVTTNGSFDILHVAHLHILRKAKEQGDILIVLLNSDDSIRRFKGEKRPILPEKERAEMLLALKFVDYVVIFTEDKPLKVMGMIKPDVHVKGGSFIPERIKEEKELVESHNGQLKNFELEGGYSTTNIIDTIVERHRE